MNSVVVRVFGTQFFRQRGIVENELLNQNLAKSIDIVVYCSMTDR